MSCSTDDLLPFLHGRRREREIQQLYSGKIVVMVEAIRESFGPVIERIRPEQSIPDAENEPVVRICVLDVATMVNIVERRHNEYLAENTLQSSRDVDVAMVKGRHAERDHFESNHSLVRDGKRIHDGKADGKDQEFLAEMLAESGC